MGLITLTAVALGDLHGSVQLSFRRLPGLFFGSEQKRVCMHFTNCNTAKKDSGNVVDVGPKDR